jgi:hypothetical protein
MICTDNSVYMSKFVGDQRLDQRARTTEPGHRSQLRTTRTSVSLTSSLFCFDCRLLSSRVYRSRIDNILSFRESKDCLISRNHNTQKETSLCLSSFSYSNKPPNDESNDVDRMWRLSKTKQSITVYKHSRSIHNGKMNQTKLNENATGIQSVDLR